MPPPAKTLVSELEFAPSAAMPVCIAEGPFESDVALACFHCGERCPDDKYSKEGRVFCCTGCLFVHDLLRESGLAHFYDLNKHPGVSLRARGTHDGRWDFLDESTVTEKLLDFTDGRISRVTLQVPGVHCVACVWLLENLFRLSRGIGQSRVNFARREVSVSFNPEEIRLSGVVRLLSSIGYEPQLTLGELAAKASDNSRKRQWLQIGIAGFAFGNIMLLSLPGYIGLDTFSGPMFKLVFGYASLALALPVVIYSAADYWKSALLALKQRVVTLEIPIALGLAAIYGQSAYEIIGGRGEGYLDSLSGLIFLLLCGKVFQQKAHDRIVFDRDYRCFFPLSVLRRTQAGEERVAISQLVVGDQLLLRHGELLPADARLLSDACEIDYSFVSGESEPVPRKRGDYLYAGGRQLGSVIEVETVKPVSQSYLSSLWEDEAFKEDREDDLNSLTNRYSRRFTPLVVGVAVAAAILWGAWGDWGRGFKAFTSVLIVACPCALALAAPFATGTAQRFFAGREVFLRNTRVVEKVANIDTIVFDKTGTLSLSAQAAVGFETASGGLQVEGEEAGWVRSVAGQSTHPYSARVAGYLRGVDTSRVEGFQEHAGCGVEGHVGGHHVLLGSMGWLAARGITGVDGQAQTGAVVATAIDGRYRGAFILENHLRPKVSQTVKELGRTHEVYLLSGDNFREREVFAGIFGDDKHLPFNQTPHDKLNFVKELRQQGRKVLTAGDGLNDAGALKASDVGVAVVEEAGRFSPASDIIMPGSELAKLPGLIRTCRRTAQIVRLSFGISAFYNLAGISVAAYGILSPLICAVLMPLSSVCVVGFACGATHWFAAREGMWKRQSRQ